MSDTTEVPILWSHEEDTYTNQGSEFIDAIKNAVRPIIEPLVKAGVDAAHLKALTGEAVEGINYQSWAMRNNI